MEKFCGNFEGNFFKERELYGKLEFHILEFKKCDNSLHISKIIVD